MKPENFDLPGAILERRSGLELSRDTIYLLESRLTPVAHKHGFENLDQVAQSIRAMVRFQQFNLLHDPRPFGGFDIVFCRNVLMFFGRATKRRVLDGIAALLPPDGVLYLGAEETVLGVTERFHPIPGQRGLYGPADAATVPQRMAG